jgi:hypothetical protein
MHNHKSEAWQARRYGKGFQCTTPDRRLGKHATTVRVQTYNHKSEAWQARRYGKASFLIGTGQGQALPFGDATGHGRRVGTSLASVGSCETSAWRDCIWLGLEKLEREHSILFLCMSIRYAGEICNCYHSSIFQWTCVREDLPLEDNAWM